jgi:hypothetical protein
MEIEISLSSGFRRLAPTLQRSILEEAFEYLRKNAGSNGYIIIDKGGVKAIFSVNGSSAYLRLANEN